MSLHQQATAECTQNKRVFLSAKSLKYVRLNFFQQDGSNTNPPLQSLSLTTEILDKFKMGTCCPGEILNLEEIPSEESDALREAYRSLGFGEDPETLQERHDVPGDELQDKQLQQLKLPLREEAEVQETETEPTPSKACYTRCNAPECFVLLT